MLRTCAIVLAIAVSAAPALANSPTADGVRGQYLDQIEQWVAVGGPRDRYPLDVVAMCQKLMFLRQTGVRGEYEEFNRRASHCAKLVQHRLSAQPEFSDARIRKTVCVKLARIEPVFVKLCRDAGISGVR